MFFPRSHLKEALRVVTVRTRSPERAPPKSIGPRIVEAVLFLYLVPVRCQTGDGGVPADADCAEFEVSQLGNTQNVNQSTGTVCLRRSRRGRSNVQQKC